MNAPSTGPVASEMLRRLERRLTPSRIELIDDSEQHRGHGGHNPAGESHFSLAIESPAFAGKSRVERQRMVYPALGDLMRRAGPCLVDPRHRAGRKTDGQSDHPDHHAGHPRPRRVQGAPRAAGAGADDGRAVHLRRPVRPGAAARPARAWTCARTRTSTSPPSPICSTARSSIAIRSASRKVIEPGAVNLMTAGKGIVHSERSPADSRAAGPELLRHADLAGAARRQGGDRPGVRPCARRRPAAGRGRRRVGAGADGHACGARPRATPAIRRPSTPTSCSTPAAACRSTPRPTSAR